MKYIKSPCAKCLKDKYCNKGSSCEDWRKYLKIHRRQEEIFIEDYRKSRNAKRRS